MRSHAKPPPPLDRLLQQWQREHRELQRMIGELRWWSSQPVLADGQRSEDRRFEELSAKLAEVREALFEHFDREVEIGWELPAEWIGDGAEMEAARRDAAEDHQELLERIDQLIGQLRSSPGPFESWQDALDELDLLLDSLDEHEELEEAGFQWMRASQTDAEPP